MLSRLSRPLFFTLALTAACGGGAEPETTGGNTTGGNTAQDEATISPAWSMVLGDEQTDCFVLGAAEVQIEATRKGGEPVTMKFLCEDGAGKADPLPLGEYTILAKLLDAGGEPIVALPESSATLAKDGEDVPLNLVFDVPAAQFTVSWEISKDGAPAACEDAGAHRVEALVTNVKGGVSFGTTFDCADGLGTTPYVPLGDYGVVLSLMYEQDVVLVSSDEFPGSLTKKDEVVSLPEVTFILAPSK